MYFPSDMNFQYFFFSTYLGFFLQVLPITLIAGIVYNSLGGGWTDIQTKEEHKFFDETASIYLQAFREARAEIKSSQPAPSVETSVNIRA